MLTLADGLFGAPSVGAKPIPWQTFSNSAPNSLLFSRDRVAIDCVMCDLLRTEWGPDEAAYDYLRLAHERGLGQFERGDPWGSGYTQFDYVRVGNYSAAPAGLTNPAVRQAKLNKPHRIWLGFGNPSRAG